jgi:hypothetical protein
MKNPGASSGVWTSPSNQFARNDYSLGFAFISAISPIERSTVVSAGLVIAEKGILSQPVIAMSLPARKPISDIACYVQFGLSFFGKHMKKI